MGRRGLRHRLLLDVHRDSGVSGRDSMFLQFHMLSRAMNTAREVHGMSFMEWKKIGWVTIAQRCGKIVRSYTKYLFATMHQTILMYLVGISLKYLPGISKQSSQDRLLFAPYRPEA